MSVQGTDSQAGDYLESSQQDAGLCAVIPGQPCLCFCDAAALVMMIPLAGASSRLQIEP